MPRLFRKTIRLVVAYSTGGSIDLAARRIADQLGTELGQSVVVENRGGANGIPASEYVANSPPDGHTILFTTLPAHAGNRWAYKKLPYDTVGSFTPVTVLSVVPLVLVATPSLPVSNVAELAKLQRSRPKPINYASFGIGGMAHLAGVQMNLLGRTEMNHVPYKGGGAAMADVLAGHVDLYFAGVASALPLIKDGKLKALAVTSTTRVRSLAGRADGRRDARLRELRSRCFADHAGPCQDARRSSQPHPGCHGQGGRHRSLPRKAGRGGRRRAPRHDA
jgi:tripartite-type tricarboxylate transporter receptor subunit TctC